MAFDTVNERLAMVNGLFAAVPKALPEAASGFTAKMGAMMLDLFPVALAAPVAPTPRTQPFRMRRRRSPATGIRIR